MRIIIPYGTVMMVLYEMLYRDLLISTTNYFVLIRAK